MNKCIAILKKIAYKVLDGGFYLRNRVFMLLFYFCPVQQNKIVFNNFNGRGYGDNPKYIAEELMKQGNQYDLVWLVSDLSAPLPPGVRPVKAHGVRRLYEMATAKVIVANVKNELRLIKKKKQFVIQTWHGSYSSKRLERAAADTLSAAYLRESRKNSRQTDLFLSNSRVLSDCYREDFWCDCEILECGFPRNDILFADGSAARKRVCQALGVPETCKLVMYAPTFRDDGSVAGYGLDCQGVVKTLEKDGNDWRLLVRMHPNVPVYQNLFTFNSQVVDATAYPDMQELLVAADVLITDYSSTVFEFAAMNKAVFLFVSDMASYRKSRGLLPTFDQIPYPHCEDNASLLDTIANSTEASVRAEARQFIETFGSVDKGDASAQVARRIRQAVASK